MSQIQQLRDFIHYKNFATYEEVKREAILICPLYRESTWNRGLRRSTDIKRIYKYPDLPIDHNVIIGYKSMKIKAEPEMMPVSFQKGLFQLIPKPSTYGAYLENLNKN